MAIPNERQSTKSVLADARYHRASLKANSATAHLAERVENHEKKLRASNVASEAAEDARVEAFAVLERVDFDFDDACRVAELETLAAVNKDRGSLEYRACFPSGLSGLIAPRGAEQARLVESCVTQLRARFSAVAERHAEPLLALAKRAADAETAYLEAEKAHAAAFVAERLARAELIRQLQRNEGALGELYPGDKAAVRSYFRKRSRRAKASAGGAGSAAS